MAREKIFIVKYESARGGPNNQRLEFKFPTAHQDVNDAEDYRQAKEMADRAFKILGLRWYSLAWSYLQ